MSQPTMAVASSARVVGIGIVAASCALIGAGFALFTPKRADYKIVAAATRQTFPAPPKRAPANSAQEAVSPKQSEARIALGKRIFFDKSLSEPAGTSCASCHEPAHGFAGNNGSKLGVALGSRPGHFATRNTPSVMYLKFTPRFHLHWEEDAPVVDAYGGFFWDGRVDELADVPKQPLMNPNEMNNASSGDILAKLQRSEYANELRQEFGALESADAAVQSVGVALAAYLSSPELSPFSSKYDQYIQHRVDLTKQEARGLRLFKDSAKGGCSECHKLNDTIPNPERSLFTDYGFDSVGAPRNSKLPVNADATHFDLGLCQRPNPRFRSDSPEFCGSFRTPSLRNVALRESFMHSGTFSSLRDVVEFYASRSTSPRRWYKAEEFDDLPVQYRQYVNVDQAPYNRHAGDAPALDASEIDAIVAFLDTLSDTSLR